MDSIDSAESSASTVLILHSCLEGLERRMTSGSNRYFVKPEFVWLEGILVSHSALSPLSPFSSFSRSMGVISWRVSF